MRDGMGTTNPSAPSAPLASPDHRLIADSVQTKLPFHARFATLAPLAGDASNRRYFRIHLTGEPNRRPASVILMQLAEPEAFKASEEAVSGGGAHIQELPFVNILRHLAKAGVSVPTLYYYDQAAGLLYLEDFGDLTLMEACQQASADDLLARYKQAIDDLVRIHSRATAPADPGCIAFHRGFDPALLMWEFEHFLEYGVVARNGKPMCSDDYPIIQAEFRKIAEFIAGQPRVFTHRDYHSRNLMVDGTRIGVIDFQDALMGPAAYDLASLLRDAYIQLDEAVVDELVAYYLERFPNPEAFEIDRRGFRHAFDLTSIQRNLKAAGRFVYIDRVKHNPKFLSDIPRVLGYVRRNFEKYPELATLRKHLAPYVPELQ
jgi:aminoglycoside/choline kinase family phosphotransferase